MENNIFEGAKFGDKFLTRDGQVAIYWQQICYPEEYMCKTFILENECIETDLYKGITLINGVEHSCNTDIVSKYQEPIDEGKLKELANEYILNTFQSSWEDEELHAYKTRARCGFKAGYKKAMEE